MSKFIGTCHNADTVQTEFMVIRKKECCKSQMAEEYMDNNIVNILWERWLRWLGHGLPYGPPVHTTASTVLVGTRIQERTRSTKSELDEHSQQRPTKDGVHVGGKSRGGSSWQTRMASECGPMCPVGCGMNQRAEEGQEERKKDMLELEDSRWSMDNFDRWR